MNMSIRLYSRIYVLQSSRAVLLRWNLSMALISITKSSIHDSYLLSSMGKQHLIGRFSLVLATLGPHACFSSHWHKKHRRFKSSYFDSSLHQVSFQDSPRLRYPTSCDGLAMDVLGSAIVFSLVYVYVINRFGPITVTHIIIILAVFCAAKSIVGVDLWQLLWVGLEKVTGVIGWSIRFIVYACFFITCLVVVPKIVAFV
ncbi:hypothetical protein ARMGADRAFT_312844 [Armillaria gallica]|uniref:Uncharacterized protein n=1 Tax=Armillaria gallica TaxID=47427 RepID=A0A2H3DMJ2_ARMGA|nr:hypothetical protein ARMGADRAFT_312844 [Armillaria gallica]